MMMVQMIVGKNKITSVKNKTVFFKMYPDLASLEGITEEQFFAIKADHQTEIKRALNEDSIMEAKYKWDAEGLVEKHQEKWTRESV